MNVEIKKYTSCLAASLIFFYDFLQMNMLNTLGKSFIDKFSLNMIDYSLFSSLYFYGMLPMFFLSGFLLDRLNTKKIILCVIMSYTVCAFVSSYSVSLLVICICRTISGACGGFCLLSLIVLASNEFGKGGISKITGLMITIGMSGGLFAQLPLQLLTMKFGLENALTVNAFLGLIITIIVFFVVNDVQPKHSNVSITLRQVASVIANKQLLIVGMYSGLVFLPVTFLGGFCGTEFLITCCNYSRTIASFISGMIFIGVIIGSTCFGFVPLNKYLSEKFYMIGSIILILILSIISTATKCNNMYPMSAMFFFLGFFSAAQVMSFPLVAKSVPKNVLGASEGIMSVVIMLQTAACQTIFGYVMEHQKNFSHALLVFFAFLCIGTVISMFIRKPSH